MIVEGLCLAGASLILYALGGVLGAEIEEKRNPIPEFKLEPKPVLPSNKVEKNAFAIKIEQVCKTNKICNKDDEYVRVTGYGCLDQVHYYWLHIPKGLTAKKLMDCEQEFSQYLKKHVKIVKHQYDVVVKVYDRDLPRYIANVNLTPSDDKMVRFPIGQGWDKIFWWDLKQRTHAYFGGETGSGKSSLTHSIITYSTLHYPDLELVLVDFKDAELSIYENMTNVIYYETDVHKVTKLVEQTKKEVRERFVKMKEHHAKDWKDYNQLNPSDPIKQRLIIFDEVYDFMELNKDEVAVLKSLAVILSKCRACGIHFLFSTQKAVDKVLPSELTTHLSYRVGLRFEKSKDSENLLDCTELSQIPPSYKGRGYVKTDNGLEEFQAFYVTEERKEQIALAHQRQEVAEEETIEGWLV